MKKFTEAALRHPNPLISLVEDGYTPQEIKEAIVSALKPFFRNHEILEEYAIDSLAGEVVNLAFVQSNSYAQSAFDHFCDIYRRAVAVDREATFRCCADCQSDVAAGISEYWSLFYLEVPKRELELLELKHEVFRNIGTLVEAVSQPLLRQMLVLLRISEGKVCSYSDIRKLTLGRIVRELATTTQREDIYSPKPWAVPINQWRNIAQHYSSTVENDRVVVTFRAGQQTTRLELSRDDLNEVLRIVMLHYRALKIAHVFFFFDNLKAITPFMQDIVPRPESIIFAFVAGVSTQGFKVTDIRVAKLVAEVWLTDLRPLNQPERLLHASQLVFAFWNTTDAPLVKVHYLRSEMDPLVTFSVTAEVCNSLAYGQISMGEFAKHVIDSAGQLPEYALRRPTRGST